MNQQKQPFSFDLIDVIRFIINYFWLLVGLTILGGLMGYIFTGPSFITPKFKGSAIMYPTANSSFSQSLLEPNYVFQKKPMDFGDKEEGEQLTQILKSDELLMSVIKRFKLYEHYGFDTSKYWSPTVLKLMLKKNVKIERTDYMAIQVEVLDKDPQFAMDMANYFCESADKIKGELYKQKAEKTYVIAKKEYEEKTHYVDSLNQLLQAIRKKGVYDYKTQVELLYDQWVQANAQFKSEKAKLAVYEKNKSSIPDSTIVKTQARVKAAEVVIKDVQPLLNNLGNLGGTYNDITDKLEYEQEKLSKLKQAYEQAKIDYFSQVPQKYVVSYAQFPDIPSEPRRLLLTFIAAVGVFVVSLLALIFFKRVLPIIRQTL